MIGFGYFFMACPFFLFGLASYLELSKMLYILATAVGRIMHGFGTIMLASTAYSSLTMSYPQNRNAIISIAETALNVGQTIGPLITGYVNTNYGFANCMFFYCAVNLVFCLMTFTCIPTKIDYGSDSIRESMLDNRETAANNHGNKSNYISMLEITDLTKNRFYFFALMFEFISFFIAFVIEPYLSDRMIAFGVPTSNVSFVFAVLYASSTISCLIVPLIPKKVSNKLMLIFTGILAALGMLFTGPSRLLPNELSLTYLGVAIVGIASPVMSIYGLDEMIQVGLKNHPRNFVSVNDISSTLYTQFRHMGGAVGMGFGGVSNFVAGFRVTTDLVSFICTAATAVYILAIV